MAEPTELTTIIQRFRDTTKQLEELADAARLLSDSADAFDNAKTHAEDLIQSSVDETRSEITKLVTVSTDAMDASQRSLRDSTSNVTRLTEQLRDASRELADIADAFRSMKPEVLKRETLRNRLEIRIAIAVSVTALIFSVVATLS